MIIKCTFCRTDFDTSRKLGVKNRFGDIIMCADCIRAASQVAAEQNKTSKILPVAKAVTFNKVTVAKV